MGVNEKDVAYAVVGFEQFDSFPSDVCVIESNEGQIGKLAARVDEILPDIAGHLLHHFNVLFADRNAACLDEGLEGSDRQGLVPQYTPPNR